MNLLYDDYISVMRYRIKFLHKHYYFVIVCDNLNGKLLGTLGVP